MKRSLLMVLCLSVVSAFAGVYDIEEFSAKDAGTPDDYIVAEFGGTLKVAPADEVETLQEGRLVVRQKFEDPFGESETSYQLYQGGKGDLSSMTALTADGVDYSKLVSAKLYERRGMSADKDVEKVYFDGKAVYAPGLTTAIVFIDGSPVTLKGDAPAAEEETVAAAVPAASSSDEEECDEYDPDCEDEDEEDYLNHLCDLESPIEWFLNNFGKDEFSTTVKEHDLINWEDVIDWVAREDGYGCLAAYDGKELELENDLYAYRIN